MGVQIQGDTGNVIATKGTYSGNVTIGGTLTYEDVTNVDSIGLVTARNGIEVGASPGVAASISVDGNMIVSGISTFGGDVQVPDKIIHSGDTDTAIRFPAADTISAETGGSERARIDSSGRLMLGTTTEGFAGADELTLATSGSTGITIRSGTSNDGNIYFSDGDDGSSAEYQGYIQYEHAHGRINFGTGATTRVKIDGANLNISNGNLKFETAGKGIDFSEQTPTSASGTNTSSEVLDHYEEGTWTPTLTTSNGGAFSTNSSHAYGYYTRIGRIVHAHFVFNSYSDQYSDILGSGSSSDGVTGGGLPFPSANNSQEYYHGDIGYYAPNFPGSLSLATPSMYIYQGANSSNFYFYLPNDNAASQLIQVGQFGQAYIRGCIHYLTAY